MNGSRRGGKQGSSAREPTVFEWVDDRHRFLTELYQQFLQQPSPELIPRCMYLAHQLQKVSAVNPVGLLAALQLNRTAQHQRIKELFAAVLCEMLAKEAGIAASARLYLVCAALTQDLGMLELQEQALDRQANPLTAGQKRQIHKHTELGIRLLQRAKVKEALWLKTLEQHHEQPDGQGYPQGLKGDQITRGAAILHVADAYVAMVRPRGDRPALVPKDAIREIFIHRGRLFETTVARNLAAILGMYPPGSWVRLYNGELGVVSGLGSSHPFPKVSVILSAEGDQLPRAETRDTREDRYTVVETVKAPFHFSLSSVLNAIWPNIKVESGQKP